MTWIYLAMAAAAGAFANVQAGGNVTLNKGLEQPLLAAIVAQLAGLTAMLVAVPFVGIHWPEGPKVAGIPWWGWAAGAIEAVTVTTVFLAAGRTGAALFGALTVTGGTIMSLLLDHYGWLGFAQHTASWQRLAGAALLIAGTALVGLF